MPVARESRFGLGVVLAGASALAVVLVLVPPSRARTMVALLLPMVSTFVLAAWGLKRLGPTERSKILGVGAVTALVLGIALSFPTNVMAVLWGLPASIGSTFVVGFALRGAYRAVRHVAIFAVFLASLAPWLVLRADGASGQMLPNFVWTWRQPVSVASSLSPASPSGPWSVAVTAQDWPGFRGRSRDGVVDSVAATNLGREWAAHPPKERWRRPIGPGWSSFAVAGDLACTQSQEGEMERVMCLEADTGRTIWAHEDRTRFEETASGPGPRATPLISDAYVYALGATGLLNCLDFRTGELVWSVDLSDPSGEAPEWGFASSPLVWGELVYVSPAGIGGARLLALDRHTGHRLWRAPGDVAGYGSAQLELIGGVAQILLFDGGGLVSFDPTTGETLWQHVWPDVLPRAAQPQLVDGDQVVVGMGYGRGIRSFRPRRGDFGWQLDELWSSTRLKPKFNGFVVAGTHLYGLDEGILVCVDVTTGERKWKGGRYGYGQLLLVGDILLIVTESGDLVTVEATPTGHHELARTPVLSGKSWSQPALARGRLYVRNGSEAACFDLGQGKL